MSITIETILTQFDAWFAEAAAHPSIIDATAMTVATCGESGRVSARILLLKGHDARGFTFYTTEHGKKSVQLRENPHAALCFHWPALQKQIRIEGQVERASDAEADAYFASRSRASQVGAWASDQSRPLVSREALMARVAEFEKQFEEKPVPRPPYWIGWRVVPSYVEFWSEGAHRLHTREVYTRIDTPGGYSWSMTLLNP